MDTARIAAVTKDLHGNSSVWFGYFTAACIALKAEWKDLEQYVPLLWQHGVMGLATFGYLADKVRRSVVATTPDPVIPAPPQS